VLTDGLILDVPALGRSSVERNKEGDGFGRLWWEETEEASDLITICEAIPPMNLS
jgi:hypothetical protein